MIGLYNGMEVSMRYMKTRSLLRRLTLPASGFLFLFMLHAPGQGVASASLAGLEILEAAQSSLIELEIGRAHV